MALNFHGGYRLEEYKNTKNLPFTNYDRAESVFIYLENGEKPCVSVGDTVLRYEKIASNGDGFVTASSVSGSVVEANERRIVIKNDMRHLSAPSDEKRPKSISEIDLNALTAYSKKYGVRGSFSGIPVYKKFAASYGKAERIIINCIECDPSSGHVRALIKENAKELVNGIKLIMHGMGIRKCVVAVVKKDSESIDRIKDQLADRNGFVFAEVNPKYPCGSKHLLLNAIYKSEFPRDSEPWDNGYPLLSAETVINLYKSFCDGLPVVAKAVSVSGGCVETPMNFRVPIGTPISYLLEETGISAKGNAAYVVGGTLNGYQVNGGAPVLASTNTVIAIKEKNYRIGDCIKCARCTMMCPMHLAPFKFHENFDLGKYEENEKIGIFNCIECGICSFVCLGKVDLLGEIRREKALSSGKESVYADFAAAPSADETEDEAEDVTEEIEETVPVIEENAAEETDEAEEAEETEEIVETAEAEETAETAEGPADESAEEPTEEENEEENEGLSENTAEEAEVVTEEAPRPEEVPEEPEDAEEESEAEPEEGSEEAPETAEEAPVTVDEEKNEESVKDEENKPLIESGHFTEDDGRKADVIHRASEEVTEYRFDIGEDE